MGRISYASDLCAKNVVYHHQCRTNFGTGRGIPKQSNINDGVSDKRPKLDEYQAALQERNEAFFFVARYVKENADEQETVAELTKKMDDYLKETGSTQNVYGVQYMKKKLEDHFGDKIIQSSHLRTVVRI